MRTGERDRLSTNAEHAMTATDTARAGSGSSVRTGPSRCCRRAAERPVHAYLLVGPRGSGVEDAARCFAAALVALRTATPAPGTS